MSYRQINRELEKASADDSTQSVGLWSTPTLTEIPYSEPLRQLYAEEMAVTA
jgi:hypothetical protein